MSDEGIFIPRGLNQIGIQRIMFIMKQYGPSHAGTLLLACCTVYN